MTFSELDIVLHTYIYIYMCMYIYLCVYIAILHDMVYSGNLHSSTGHNQPQIPSSKAFNQRLLSIYGSKPVLGLAWDSNRVVRAHDAVVKTLPAALELRPMARCSLEADYIRLIFGRPVDEVQHLPAQHGDEYHPPYLERELGEEYTLGLLDIIHVCISRARFGSCRRRRRRRRLFQG